MICESTRRETNELANYHFKRKNLTTALIQQKKKKQTNVRKIKFEFELIFYQSLSFKIIEIQSDEDVRDNGRFEIMEFEISRNRNFKFYILI